MTDDGKGCERTLINVDGVLYSSEPQGPERTQMVLQCSKDGGKTWSSPTKTLGGTHCSLIQLPDGVLLCGYHGGAPRLALSADKGGTWYANMPWLTEEGTMSRGWYTSAELVDKTTAVVLIKEAPAPHIIRACLLRR